MAIRLTSGRRYCQFQLGRMSFIDGVDMSQIIDLGKLRFHFAGDYDATTMYEVNDIVNMVVTSMFTHTIKS